MVTRFGYELFLALATIVLVIWVSISMFVFQSIAGIASASGFAIPAVVFATYLEKRIGKTLFGRVATSKQ